MKTSILFILIFIVSCKVVTEDDLYNKNHPLYGALQEAAAKECLEKNQVFTNLKSDSFLEYDILNNGNYIEVKDGSSTYYIRIDSVDANNLTFSFLSDSTLVLEFLKNRQYTISLAENNKVIDMFAQGVCRKDYGGDPEASNSQLTVNNNRFFIQDDTDINSDDTPDAYTKRIDKFVLNETIPAFLFLWRGSYQTKLKEEDGNETDGDINVSLEITDLNTTTCPKTTCTTPSSSATLNINVNDYAIVRTNAANNGDDAVTKYYYTNF